MELAHDNVVRANDFRGAKSGVELGESYDNRIEGNNASGTLGSGIEVGELSFRNNILDNLAHENGGEGIEISDSAPVGQGNLLEGNNADANGGNGISLEGAGHMVEDNSARVNGGWGIYAAIGAVDRGGNFAAGNAEFEQCYRVICATGPIPGEPETWIVDNPEDPEQQPERELHLHGQRRPDAHPRARVRVPRRQHTTRWPGRTASTRPRSSTSPPASTPSRCARST